MESHNSQPSQQKDSTGSLQKKQMGIFVKQKTDQYESKASDKGDTQAVQSNYKSRAEIVESGKECDTETDVRIQHSEGFKNIKEVTSDSEIPSSHCGKDNGRNEGSKREVTVTSTAGMKGGKAVDTDIVGEEYISRNNTDTVIDSDVKLNIKRGGSETVGLEGGEIVGGKLRGKSTVIEGNTSTIKGSHVDIQGDPSAALSRALLSQGGGERGISLKDSEIKINYGGKTGETPPDSETKQKQEPPENESATMALSKDYRDTSYVEKKLRIMMFGETGSGKSSTSNTILGEKKFKSKAGSTKVTEKLQSEHVLYKKWDVLVIDTPELFDTQISNKEMSTEIMKCMLVVSLGLHALILVTQIKRFTEEEKKYVEQFRKYFGEGLGEYLIIIFTGKDNLDADGLTLDEYIEGSDPLLKQLVKECRNRCIAVNNRAGQKEKDRFRDELIALIVQTVNRNDGKCYTNELIEAAQIVVKEKEGELQEKNWKEREEIRKQQEEIRKKREEIRKQQEGIRKEREEIHQLNEIARKLAQTQTDLERFTEEKEELLKRRSGLSSGIFGW